MIPDVTIQVRADNRVTFAAKNGSAHQRVMPNGRWSGPRLEVTAALAPDVAFSLISRGLVVVLDGSGSPPYPAAA
jgi:hypothetical protein